MPASGAATRRRSQRVLLNLAVTVSSEDPKQPFSEATTTLAVNAHGALITLKSDVKQGQMLFVSTSASDRKQCRVVYVGPTQQGCTQFGIEFSEPAPSFWRITFPPDDWDKTFDPAEPRNNR